MNSKPTFSIITPSYRQLEWLKLCCASIADQQGITLEHIIQDAGTGTELENWITKNTNAQLYVEKDNGMYDAVNRGLRKATGEILAYLNCDEQYLPDTLQSVRNYFENHPSIDMIIGDCIMVNGKGEFLSFRKSIVPNSLHTRFCHLCAPTCTIFFRRTLIDAHHLFFDPSYRIIGDAEWMLRCLQQNIRIAQLKQPTSVFTHLGSNLSWDKNAPHEMQQLMSTKPPILQHLRSLYVFHHRIRKLFAGAYFIPPLTYSIFTNESTNIRKTFQIAHPSPIWRRE